MMKKFIALALAACVLLSGCSSALGTEKLKMETDEMQFAQPVSGDTVATITTDKGVIKVLLFPRLAPKAVENFIVHAKDGYYDNLTFYRTVENFIIQSGSPDNSTSGGESIWKIEFEDEFSDLLHNYTGALAMANHGANTNSSQFYFVTTPIGEISDEMVAKMQEAGWRDAVIDAYKQAGGAPTLDYGYTVFGQIYEGLEVAFAISRAKTDENDRPTKDITIQSIEITVVE